MVEGRTGNNLFQYLACKIIQKKYGHTYVPIDEIENINAMLMQSKFGGDHCPPHLLNDLLVVYENDMEKVLNDEIENLDEKNIVCIGYFQRSEIYVPYRDYLIESLKTTQDYWVNKSGEKTFVNKFINHQPDNVSVGQNDIVVSLRLDDFIQIPCETSDIIPPEYYVNILEEEMQYRDKLIIVSDKFRHDWEKKYIEYFEKWEPIFIQGDLISDFAVIRDCPRLIHSNSTFCWIASFLSETKIKRYIPKTNFYRSQLLTHISSSADNPLRGLSKDDIGFAPPVGFSKPSENDTLLDVVPLPHQDVYNLNINNYLKKSVFPLSYSIPDEYIIDNVDIENKTTELSPMIAGQRSTYMFGAGQENDYLKHYNDCFFVYTKKKGGWDCLRHYEILSQGAIPLFDGLEDSPNSTMVTLPKQILIDAKRELIPYEPEKRELYKEYVNKLLDHTREQCTTSANTKYFMEKINKPVKNVLLIVCHPGVNYTREFFWIGMKRYIQEIGGIAVEYPKMNYLYKNYPEENKRELVGNGYIYSSRLNDDYTFSDEEIIEKLRTKFFDIVVYGKVGPDESHSGSLPKFPLWEHVFKRYKKDEIICLYGGDERTDLKNDDTYSRHLYYTARYATCFVRELTITHP